MSNVDRIASIIRDIKSISLRLGAVKNYAAYVGVFGGPPGDVSYRKEYGGQWFLVGQGSDPNALMGILRKKVRGPNTESHVIDTPVTNLPRQVGTQFNGVTGQDLIRKLRGKSVGGIGPSFRAASDEIDRMVRIAYEDEALRKPLLMLIRKEAQRGGRGRKGIDQCNVGGTAKITGKAVLTGGTWDGSEGEVKDGTWDDPDAFKAQNRPQELTKELEEALKNHDWFYAYSDDFAYWSAGDRSLNRIRKLLDNVPKDIGRKLWKKYKPKEKGEKAIPDDPYKRS